MGMFIYKDNMQFDIAIFAGGLGSRLKNTESRPKPLVDINGKSLLSRLIISLKKTSLFRHFHILVCSDGDINPFYEILGNEIETSLFTIHSEPSRTGRIGAISYFLERKVDVDQFFACNGDTLFQNLCSSNIYNSIKRFNADPIIFLANNDSSRNDYKKVTLDYSLKKNYQNSGLFFMTRDWFQKKIIELPNILDVDELLFDNSLNVHFSCLNTTLLDAGTPDRLSYIRSIIN